MNHNVTHEEAQFIAEQLLTISKLYLSILLVLEGLNSSATKVEDIRHRLHPDGLLEFEAFLSDNSQIHIEFAHTGSK